MDTVTLHDERGGVNYAATGRYCETVQHCLPKQYKVDSTVLTLQVL